MHLMLYFLRNGKNATQTERRYALFIAKLYSGITVQSEFLIKKLDISILKIGLKQ